jgi:anti-sigma B factor antagonist
MQTTRLETAVRRVDDAVVVISLAGDVTAASDGPLTEAYQEACGHRPRGIALDFSRLQYMNSGGIGMLVTLLVRANRAHQRLTAFGLSDHYRQIFSLTRIDEAISLQDDEESALAAARGAVGTR